MSLLNQFDLISFTKNQSYSHPLGALFFSLEQKITEGRHIFTVAEDNIQANKIYESLCSIYDNVIYFPAIEVMPHSHGMPSLDILATRMQVHRAQTPASLLIIVSRVV